MSDETPVDSVDDLVVACLEARRTGRKSDCDALVREHPEFASDVAVFLDDYDRVEEKFVPLRELLGSTPYNAGDVATLGPDETAVSPVPKAGSSFGDYELLSEISRGGMGVVFQARQRSLNRIVALKMVLSGGKSTIDRERFLVEARAVARLSHPHIVPIYEVGEQSGRPFFTMEYFSGGSLRERMDELRGDQRAISQLMATVARAVEHAHRRGILHRDLKPSNVLLDDRRGPHVTDFGLAKRLDEQSDLTQAGAIVGTPSYMAPEQAEAATDLSTAVDVYGLGAVLYELLTGRPPFKGHTPIETMTQARTEAPMPPREVAADVDADLETICLKCLKKDPRARYGSADDMADDLERWFAGKPILARQVTARERLVKWARRQPLMAAAAATIGVAILGLLILGGSLWQNAELRATAVQNLDQVQGKLTQKQAELTQIDSQRRDAEQERTRAEIRAAEQRRIADEQKALADKVRGDVTVAQQQLSTVQHEARHTLYAADMLLLHAAWEGENLAAVNDLLARYQNATGSDDLRGFEWHYFYRQVHSARLSWRDIPEGKVSRASILGMAVSPDGKLLATAQMENKLKIWNLADGRLLQEIEARQTNGADKSFPNFTGLFFADNGHKLVAVVRAAPNERQVEWSVPAAASAALAVSPSLLAASSPTGYALTKSALEAISSSATTKAGRAILDEAIAKRDKLRIESLAESLEYQSYGLTDQKPVQVETFDPSRLQTAVLPVFPSTFSVTHEGRVLIVMAMDRSPDGRFLALAGAEPKGAPGRQWSGAYAGGKLIVWDLANGQIHAEQSSSVALTAVTFSPDSSTLAVGNSDGTIGVVGTDLAERPRFLPGHDGWIFSLRFTSDGSRLASGAWDGLVLLWDVAAAKEVARLRGHTSAVCRVELSPDGRTLVSGGIDGSIKVWDLAHANRSMVLRGHETIVSGLAFSGTGDELTSIDYGGAVRTWRVTDGELLRATKPNNTADLTIRTSSSGKTMAWSEGADGTILVRDIPTARETRINWKGRTPSCLTLSPDDKLLAAVDLTGKGVGAGIWNIASGRQLAALDDVKGSEATPIFAAAFSFDGKWLAVGQASDVALWDWQARKSRSILQSKDSATTGVVFSSDNKLIAAAVRSASQERIATVRIWDAQSNQLRAECHGAGQQIAALAFSPDGRRLATGGSTSSQQGILKLWDTASGREVFSAQVPMAGITAVAFSADGRRLAAGVTPIDLNNVPTGKAPSEIYVWDATPVAADTGK